MDLDAVQQHGQARGCYLLALAVEARGAELDVIRLPASGREAGVGVWLTDAVDAAALVVLA
jgi:hypothetical protein